MFSLFGLIAVVLAAVGIYGVMSFSVSRRTQEFGVRMALGAHRREMALATVGGTAITNTLFNVSARDPITYIAVVLLIVVVSIVAVLVPGQRAARVDPLTALRVE